MSLAASILKIKNPLLVQDQPGKVKQSCYDLPQEDFTYGKKVVDDPYPINHVCNDWQYATGQDKRKQVIQKDFKTSNKIAVINGLHTAKHQTDFRATNQFSVEQKKGSKIIPIMLPQQDFTYGEANRPSTPMKLVLGNCYALFAEDKNKQMYETKTSQPIKTKTSYADTKNHKLLKQKNKKLIEFHNKDVKQQKFKINKFVGKSVPKVNTNLESFGLTSINKQIK